MYFNRAFFFGASSVPQESIHYSERDLDALLAQGITLRPYQKIGMLQQRLVAPSIISPCLYEPFATSVYLANLNFFPSSGVNWIISLWENGLNGILADEMGNTAHMTTFDEFERLFAGVCNGV